MCSTSVGRPCQRGGEIVLLGGRLETAGADHLDPIRIDGPGRLRHHAGRLRKIDASLYRWSSMKAAWAMQFFAPTLKVLEGTFRLLEARIPPPIRKSWKDGFVFRYAERTIHQAIVQKLARTISGLHAIDVLLAQGLFQEQGMIQRALDEIDEDIAFLSLAVIHGELTRLHQEYLDYFYAEEFGDPSDIMASHTSRGMVKREKIRAYVSRNLHGEEGSRANVVGKIITKSYSGFIHAASPHIMDMYGGWPPRFDISGDIGTLRDAAANDALNYFLRALHSMAFAAKAFGDQALFAAMLAEADKLQARIQAREAG
jgi:hypothetical protein